MGLFGRLFGTEKALAATIDGVKDGLDALVYTDEERAGDAAKDRSEARAMVVKWMDATKGQNIARRMIALLVIVFWMGHLALASALSILVAFVSDTSPTLAEKLAEASTVALSSAQTMDGNVMLIMGFYFAAPHMREIVGKFSKSRSN